MARILTRGTCELCKATFSKHGMTKHLRSCLEKVLMSEPSSGEGSSLKKYFHLLIEGQYRPEYWLHLKVSSHIRLGDLDRFLRDIWLECCGHLSAFRIGRDELKKNGKLEYTLQPGMTIIHEYDFGSTTELLVKVISKFESRAEAGEIEILSRNHPPDIRCSYCGKTATSICTECQCEGKGWLCDVCAEKHACGSDLLLPVVNSPRTGVCGYTGG